MCRIVLFCLAAVIGLASCSGKELEAAASPEPSQRSIPTAPVLTFERITAGDADEAWPDGQPVQFLEFSLTNNLEKSVELRGTQRGTSILIWFEDMAMYSAAANSDTWVNEFPLTGHVSFNESRISVSRGSTVRILARMQPAMITPSASREFWKACVVGVSSNSNAEICSAPFRIEIRPGQASSASGGELTE